jgi:hypothetical protein
VTRSLFTLYLLVVIGMQSSAQLKTDSAKPYTLIISPRINSAGYFPFTGAVLNHNVNFDFTVVFEKADRGFVLFQSFDLQNKNSPINYFQPCLFEKFPLGASLSFGVYFGYLFSQMYSFSDKAESDYFGALTQNWAISKKMRLENTMLFGNLTTQMNLVNRLELLYTLDKFSVDFYLHERVVLETKDLSTSGAIAVNLPRVKLADKLFALATLTYNNYLSKNRPSYALENGFFFSLAFPIDLSK